MRISRDLARLPFSTASLRAPLKTLLSCAVLCATLVGCGSDRDGRGLLPGSNGVVNLSGDAVVGGTLSASISDPDGVEPGSESYQWFSDGDLIAGAATSSYTLSRDEGGELVTAVVRYTDSGGLRETVESAPLDIQAAFTLGALDVHGLVDGADCDIAAVDANGVAAGNALASGLMLGVAYSLTTVQSDSEVLMGAGGAVVGMLFVRSTHVFAGVEDLDLNELGELDPAYLHDGLPF